MSSRQLITNALCAQMVSLLLKTTKYSAKNAQKTLSVLRAIIYYWIQVIGEKTHHPSTSLSATIRMLVLEAICQLALLDTKGNFATLAASLEILGIQENLLMSVLNVYLIQAIRGA